MVKADFREANLKQPTRYKAIMHEAIADQPLLYVADLRGTDIHEGLILSENSLRIALHFVDGLTQPQINTA